MSTYFSCSPEPSHMTGSWSGLAAVCWLSSTRWCRGRWQHDWLTRSYKLGCRRRTGGCADHDARSTVQAQQCTAVAPGRNPAEHRTEATAYWIADAQYGQTWHLSTQLRSERASVVNHTIVTDPAIWQPCFDLPRHTWSMMNRFWTGQCPRRASLHRWGLVQSLSCDCGQWQTMNHIVHRCLLRKLKADWIYSKKRMMTQSHVWNLQRLQHLRYNKHSPDLTVTSKAVSKCTQARRKQFDIGPANPFPSPFPFPSLTLEVGSLNTARRSGECCKLASGIRPEPQQKSNLVHFSLKIWHPENQMKIVYGFFPPMLP